MSKNGAQAREFFEQLDEFSRRYVESQLKLSSVTSPWGSKEYDTDTPLGAIIHFTADEDWLRVLRWFLVEKFRAEVSVHAVVVDRRLPAHEELAKDLPLVLELPATVIQVRPPHTQAWHATWTNGMCYGIENVNAGPLRKLGYEDPQVSKFASWRPRDQSQPEWTMPWNVSYKIPIELYGRWWEPYTSEQVHANVILLRYVQQLFGTLQKPWILGHENVQGVNTPGTHRHDKLDTGPHYPLHGVREAVFDDWKPVERYEWFHEFASYPGYGEKWRSELIVDYSVRVESVLPPSPAAAWDRFRSTIQDSPNRDGFGRLWKTALKLLGYGVSNVWDEVLDTDERTSVWIFQKMMGLKPDSIPGVKTRWAIVKRLRDRGFLAR